MLHKPILNILIMFLVVIGVSLAAAPALAQEPVGGSGENFIFVNYIGRELNLDLDDVTYTIPGPDTMPDGGRLALTLSAGKHKYAANVAAVQGAAGEFTVEPGAVVGRAARFEKTSPVVDINGILLEAPRDYVSVFEFDPLTAPQTPVQVLDTWLPAAPALGQSGVVWANYTRDELTVDLNGEIYKVAPPAGKIPGRLQIDPPPGDYSYTVSVPHGSINGLFKANAGQVTGFSITADLPPEPEYDVGEKYKPHAPVTLHLFAEDLSARAATVQPATLNAAPAILPATGGLPVPAAPQISTPPVTGEELLIKNYAGDTLLFTINSQAHPIFDNAEHRLNLPPGEYTYTASTPFAAVTGTVNVKIDQGVELSIATNVGHDVLNVYQ